MTNETFHKLLADMKELHDSKNEDYSSSGFYDNFHKQALISDWFDKPIDRAFSSMIAVKLARIAVLRNVDKIPNNESLADSFKDLAVYAALWASYYLDENK